MVLESRSASLVIKISQVGCGYNRPSVCGAAIIHLDDLRSRPVVEGEQAHILCCGPLRYNDTISPRHLKDIKIYAAVVNTPGVFGIL